MAAEPGGAGDDRFTGEQAALRRVATLVARGVAPEQVFAAVTEEAGRLQRTDYATISRYDPNGVRTILAAWSRTGPAVPVGTQQRLGGRNVPTLVSETGGPARIDDYSSSSASGPIAEAVREFGVRAGVGVPVSVEGQLWGVMAVGSPAGPLPAGTEEQLAGFTELAATAIANAQARTELRGFAEEQAALRRVATLVARAASAAEVLTAVTEEAGRLVHADHSSMGQYDHGGTRTVVAAWDSTGPTLPVGTRWSLGGRNLHTMVFQSGRPARIDDYGIISGPVADAVREIGLRAAHWRAVGSPGRGARRCTARTAGDRPRPAPGDPGRERPGPGAEDAGPPIRRAR